MLGLIQEALSPIMHLMESIQEILVIQLKALGVRVSTARRRRGLRQTDLASRAQVSRATVQAVERGDATVSIGSVAQVLWAMGLAEGLDLIADPTLDEGTGVLAYSPTTKRVRVERRGFENDF